MNIIILFLFVFVGKSELTPCKKRFFSESFICVCDAEHCDDFPNLDEPIGENVLQYTTSRNSMRFQVKKLPIQRMASAVKGVSINPRNVYQTIAGFGGAFTDAAAINIHSLPPSLQDKLLNSYFSKNGLNYNLGRVPIASTDFSTREYSYDESIGDFRLRKFALTRDDVEGKIPLIKRAEEIRGSKLKLVAGTWGAPSWMKTDNKIMSHGHIRPLAYSAFANYHIKFLESYASYGIEFWMISNGNEPVVAPFSNKWLAPEMAFWLGNYLGPKLNSTFPNVHIFMLDDFPEAYLSFAPVLLNRQASKFIKGIAFHPYTSTESLKRNLDIAHASYPEKEILLTEYCVGVVADKPVLLGSWDRAEKYALRIIEGLNHWSSTWLDWNLALDINGGPNYLGNFVDAAIIVNGTEFYKQPSFYIQGHFSRFIPEGSKRVSLDLQGLEKKISATGVLTTDGKIVLVFLNRFEQELELKLRTDETHGANLKLAPKSITTAVYSLLKESY